MSFIMRSKKEYQNAIRSKKMIKEALIELIKEKKGLEKISITDVVNKAGLNRGTFYNHYRSINGVVESLEDDMMSDFEATLKKEFSEDGSHGWSFFITLTEFFRQEEDSFKAIINYIPQYIFDDVKQKILDVLERHIYELYPSSKLNPHFEVGMRMCANGLAGTYVDYLKGVNGLTLANIQDEAIRIYEYVLAAYYPNGDHNVNGSSNDPSSKPLLK